MLVVNKFEELHPEHRSCVFEKGRCKRYGNGTQDCLNILKEDREDWRGTLIPKGTVTYQEIPVAATDDKSKWRYEVKTTGSSFSGNLEKVENMLKIIIKIVSNGGC